ncbi:MAG: chitobiase/beta-hexosaminidase C-terminal domain-containing protein [Calditrichia bacterium]
MPRTKTAPGSELHTNFKLSAGGEYLGLVQPNGTVVVSEYAPFTASPIFPTAILTMCSNFLDVPTPGSANTDGTLPIDPLTISPERGFYETSFDVTISTTTPNVEIRYTLDGSKVQTPSNGSVYSGAITINTTTVCALRHIKPVISQPGWKPILIFSLDDVIQQPYNIDGYPVQHKKWAVMIRKLTTITKWIRQL